MGGYADLKQAAWVRGAREHSRSAPHLITLIDAQNPAVPWLDLSDYRLWDLAGMDGLQAVKALFGSGVDQIAPWRSLALSWQGQPLSLLRLCENNFRIGLEGNPQTLAAALQAVTTDYKVWWRACDRMVSLAIPAAIGLDLVESIAIPKPPHRLVGLPDNCALPCRIEGNAVVIWRHCLLGQSVLELQTACPP